MNNFQTAITILILTTFITFAGNAGNVGASGAEMGQNQINFNVGNGVLISTGVL